MTLGVAELREANLEAGVLFLRSAPCFALFYAKSKGDIILAVVLPLGPAFLLRREEGAWKGVQMQDSERDSVRGLGPVSFKPEYL